MWLPLEGHNYTTLIGGLEDFFFFYLVLLLIGTSHRVQRKEAEALASSDRRREGARERIIRSSHFLVEGTCVV